jgi:hypothetical protein
VSASLDILNSKRIVIEPGNREPEHTHRHRSVMMVDAPARIRYYEHGDLAFESDPGRGPESARVVWIPKAPTASRTSTPPPIAPSVSRSSIDEAGENRQRVDERGDRREDWKS